MFSIRLILLDPFNPSDLQPGHNWRKTGAQRDSIDPKFIFVHIPKDLVFGRNTPEFSSCRP